MDKVRDTQFKSGELYIFSVDDLRTDGNRMWGEVKSLKEGRIELAIASEDMKTFRKDVILLSKDYRFVREASRADIRDFYFNCGYECSLVKPEDRAVEQLETVR